jgi:hypothetical protein
MTKKEGENPWEKVSLTTTTQGVKKAVKALKF